jgi:hypothetical protein
MSKILRETTSAVPVKKANGWLVTVARPGRGSTGTYSAEMLAEYGPIAFPAKTKAYFGHNLPQDRDPRDRLGTYPEGAFWNSEVNELQARLVPHKRWDALLEEMAEAGDDLDVSMYSLDFDLSESGEVTRIGPHRGNSIDAVGVGGIPGAGVKGRLYESLVESARAEFDEKPGEQVAQERKEITKMDKEIQEAFADLRESLKTIADFVTEQKTAAAEAARVSVVEKDNETVVAETLESRLAAIKAVDDASGDLLPSQVTSLRESARNGEDVIPLIESAKAIRAEAATVLSESIHIQGGGVRVGAEAKIKTPAGW